MPKLRPIESDKAGSINDQADSPLTLSVKEAAATYPGEWVLIRVTEFDRYGVPKRGQVINHWARYKDLSRGLCKSLPSSEEANGHYYLFSGDYYTCSRAEFTKSLENAAREGGVGAWREW
jgi:hypothetical protein